MSRAPCPRCGDSGIVSGTGWDTCSCSAGLSAAAEVAASAERGAARRAEPEPKRRRPLLGDVEAAIKLGPGTLQIAGTADKVAATIRRMRQAFGPRYIGRPPGSPNKERALLVAEVRADPAMTPEEIDRRGVERGIWQDVPGDYEVIGKRVRNLRKDADAQ